MVQPFALALAVGSYSLFLFLSIYAALSYLHLHYVQGAPATCDFALTMLTVDRLSASRLDVVLLSFSRRAAMIVTATMATMLTAHLTLTQRRRRQWDPGIDFVFNESLSCHRLSALEVVDVNTVNVATMTVQALLSMSILTMPRASIVLRCRSMLPLDDRSILLTWFMLTDRSRPTTSHPALLHAPIGSIQLLLLFHCSHPVACFHGVENNTVSPVVFQVLHQRPASCFLPLSALSTVKSRACLFHYSHPVLSRPTVPNI